MEGPSRAAHVTSARNCCNLLAVPARLPSVALRLLVAATLAGLTVAANSTAAHAATPAANKHRTVREARHLVALAPLPADRHRLAHAPRGLHQPATEPAAASLVDVKRFWRVAMSFQRAGRWMERHHPRGLRKSLSGSSGSHGTVVSRFVGYDARDSAAWVEAELQIEVVRGPHGTSLWRVDGMALWLDPRPIRDTDHGHRARITTHTGCPVSDRHFGDVRNSGARLARMLVPPGKPTAVLLCSYTGLNGRAFSLSAHHRYGPRIANRLVYRLRSVSLAHPDGVQTSCPMDDGSAAVAAFAFPGRPDVAIWIHATGCRYDDNGVIVGPDAIGSAVDRLLRISRQ